MHSGELLHVSARGSAGFVSSLLHSSDDDVRARDAIVTLPAGGAAPATYADLDDRSARVRSWLVQQAVLPGDRVALIGSAGADWLAAWFGVLRAGAVVVPLDPGLTRDELSALLRRTDASALVVAAAAHENAAGALADIGSARPVLPLDELAALPAAGGEDVVRAASDTALLVWTSGTTGRSKGVCLTYGNVDYVVTQLVDAQAISDDDHWLTVLPLHHMLAVCGVLACLRTGATLYVVTSLMPHELVTAIADNSVTRMMVVPLLLRILEPELRRQPAASASLRGLFCGGAPVREELLASYAGLGVPVIQGYGLTEMAPTATMNTPDGNRPGSVGRPLPGPELCLRDGEVLLRGPGLMAGYRQADGSLDPATDGDGWFHTGDLGRLDEDGYLYVVGRAKNIIVLESGKKVQPEEVEDAIDASPLLLEVCVVPMTEADGRQAGLEQVCAVVVPTYETRAAYPDDEALAQALTDDVARLTRGLSGYKRPTMVLVRETELPKTAKRSVRRDVLIRQLTEGLVP